MTDAAELEARIAKLERALGLDPSTTSLEQVAQQQSLSAKVEKAEAEYARQLDNTQLEDMLDGSVGPRLDLTPEAVLELAQQQSVPLTQLTAQLNELQEQQSVVDSTEIAQLLDHRDAVDATEAALHRDRIRLRQIQEQATHLTAVYCDVIDLAAQKLGEWNAVLDKRAATRDSS